MFKQLTFEKVDSEEFRAETPFSTYEVYQRNNGFWMPCIISHKGRYKLAKLSCRNDYESAVKICTDHYISLLTECVNTCEFDCAFNNESFEDGKNAFLNGLSIFQNPRKYGSNEYVHWNNGYLVEEAKAKNKKQQLAG